MRRSLKSPAVRSSPAHETLWHNTDLLPLQQRKSLLRWKMARTLKANHGSLALLILPETSQRVCLSALLSHAWTRVHQTKHFGILSDHWRRAASWSSCHLTILKARKSSGTRVHISWERLQNAGLAAIYALALRSRTDSTTRSVASKNAQTRC